MLLDIELTTDIRQAAQQDDIGQTLDYAVIAERVTKLITAQPLELIETVAENVAHLLLNDFASHEVRVTVYKPDALAQAQSVGVSIVRRSN